MSAKDYSIEFFPDVPTGLNFGNSGRNQSLPLVQALNHTVNSWIVHYLLIPCKVTVK